MTWSIEGLQQEDDKEEQVIYMSVKKQPWEAQGFAAAVPPLSLLKEDESSGAEW